MNPILADSGDISANIPRAERWAAAIAPRRDVRCPNSSYALFAPLHYEPNYAYPLLVWLHGERDDESQLGRVMPDLSLRNYVAIAPSWAAVPAASSRIAADHRQPELHSLEQRIFDLAAMAARRFKLNLNHVFLAGAGAGGTMAVRLGLQQAGRYTGAVAFDAPLPSDDGRMSTVNSADRLPIYLAIGAAHLSARHNVLQCIHGLDATLRQSADQHGLSAANLAEANAWMMKRMGH